MEKWKKEGEKEQKIWLTALFQIRYNTECTMFCVDVKHFSFFDDRGRSTAVVAGR